MKNANGFLKVVVMAGFLVSVSAKAEFDSFDSYKTQTDADLTKAEGLSEGLKEGLDSGTKTENGSPEDSLSQLKETIKKVNERQKRSKEEVDLRNKKQEWVKKIEKTEKTHGALKGLEKKALDRRALKLKEAQGLASQIGKTQNALDPSAFSTGDLPKACTNGVNLEQFRAALEEMGSRPFQYFQSEVQKILDEKDKALKEQRQAKLAELVKYFGELVEQDRDEEGKKDIPLTEAELTQSIKKLKKDNVALKDEHKDKQKGLVKAASELLLQKLPQMEENDKRLSDVANFFANFMQEQANKSIQIGVDSVKNLKQNCDEEKRKVFTDIESGRQAIQADLISKGDRAEVAQEKANQDAQGMIARANSLSCRNGDEEVLAAAMSGTSAINSSLDAMRAEKNVTRMLGQAVSSMRAVADMQSAVGASLLNVKEDCKTVVEAREAIKERTASLEQGQQGGPQMGSTGGGSSSGRSSIPQVGSSASRSNHTPGSSRR